MKARWFGSLTLLFSILQIPVCLGDYGEFLAGAMYEKVDYDKPIVENYGASLRYRHFFLNQSNGWAPYLQADFPGVHLLNLGLTGGYFFRSQGDVFFDGGAGLGYSRVFGLYAAAFTGIGFKLNSKFHLAIPVLMQYPGGFGIQIFPLIGWRF